MASPKNSIAVIDVPEKIIELAFEKKGIICNLRIGQYSEGREPEKKKKRRDKKRNLSGTGVFYERMETFLKTIQPGTRILLVCQDFGGRIFSFVTDVENVYWADECYPRIDFEKKPRIVRRLFGDSNLWGEFILAAAKVGRVKRQAALGYKLLFEIAKMPGGIKP